MKEIRNSSVYDSWFRKLRDYHARYRIEQRVGRLASGNAGDAKLVGGGVWELRIDYGPGYRVYYKDTGREIVILLCGGDKRTQQQDIEKAQELAHIY